MYVLRGITVVVINLRVPPMNLCIGVGTRFRHDSPVELWGTVGVKTGGSRVGGSELCV